MAYDEGLAERIRDRTDDRPAMSERKMFGGLCFMLDGNMCFGIVGSEPWHRVEAASYEQMLAQPHARDELTGRSMKGMVYVEEAGLSEDDELDTWLARGMSYASSLPPK